MKTKIIFASFFVVISFICKSQDYNFNLAMSQDASAKEDYNLALLYINKALVEYPEKLEALYQRAHVNHMLGNYQKAVEEYNFILSKDANYVQAYYALGRISDTWDDDKYQAINYYSKGIAVSSENKDYKLAGDGYFFRSNVKRKLGDNKGALADLKKGAELDNKMCITFLEMYMQIE